MLLNGVLQIVSFLGFKEVDLVCFALDIGHFFNPWCKIYFLFDNINKEKKVKTALFIRIYAIIW